MESTPTPAASRAPLGTRRSGRPHIGETWELPSKRLAEVRRVVGSERPRVIARYIENGVLTTKEVDLPMTMLVKHGQKVFA
ncbi:hypothetical protein [Variovorax boronicumulans]|uniref:hypothetical protein n=1 Tax=Variovorax boronicumulans TaxID=436515 RepID=UPI0012E65A77|nr:hypothetical protein [Variovorax boronicumulans]GER16717.1 hypothetical protein VCH24_17240 [Variovorax boronicumulans]